MYLLPSLRYILKILILVSEHLTLANLPSLIFFLLLWAPKPHWLLSSSQALPDFGDSQALPSMSFSIPIFPRQHLVPSLRLSWNVTSIRGLPPHLHPAAATTLFSGDEHFHSMVATCFPKLKMQNIFTPNFNDIAQVIFDFKCPRSKPLWFKRYVRGVHAVRQRRGMPRCLVQH